ncbi:hypothetical protein IT397_00905 [Candidatus Nomurabacteria bacterium]|nr:hypothetical protein [Candidatus Nomurabacteria bacterium]
MEKGFFDVETTEGMVTVKRSPGRPGMFTFVYKTPKGKVFDVVEGKTPNDVRDLSDKAYKFFFMGIARS